MTEATEKQINYAKALGINDPEKYDKETLIGLIDVAKKEKATFEKDVAKPGTDSGEVKSEIKTQPDAPVKDSNAGYYVSYAKDIFCATYITGQNSNTVMNDCINLVKQAIKAFE